MFRHLDILAWGQRWARRRVQSLVDIVKHGLVDENQKVKTITALTVSALAEAAAPYGIESFDDVLEPLWKGIRLLRGKVLHCLTNEYYASQHALVLLSLGILA